jgi:L-ascorbate metabolism protein UlaG (beta-lactamase superfamily)
MDRLTWLGHSTVFLEAGGQQILTDPILRNWLGPVRRRRPPINVDLGAVDAILISHLHHDHLDRPSLRLLPRTAKLVVPKGAARVVRSEGFEHVIEIDAEETLDVGGVEIKAVHALHAGRRQPFGPTAVALGYLIRAESTVYFAGDTDLYPEMLYIAPGMDLAILPVWGWGPTLRGGHMDPLRAAASLKLLTPKRAVAVHWGTLWPVGLDNFRRHRFEEPARDFFVEARRIAPEVDVVPLEPGESFEIPPSSPDRG